MKRCKLCNDPATRITYFITYETPPRFKWWQKLRRKCGEKFLRTMVCDRCYLVCEHGLETLKCKHNHVFYIDIEYYYNNRYAHCPLCKVRVKMGSVC